MGESSIIARFLHGRIAQELFLVFFLHLFATNAEDVKCEVSFWFQLVRLR